MTSKFFRSTSLHNHCRVVARIYRALSAERPNPPGTSRLSVYAIADVRGPERHSGLLTMFEPPAAKLTKSKSLKLDPYMRLYFS